MTRTTTIWPLPPRHPITIVYGGGGGCFLDPPPPPTRTPPIRRKKKSPSTLCKLNNLCALSMLEARKTDVCGDTNHCISALNHRPTQQPTHPHCRSPTNPTTDGRPKLPVKYNGQVNSSQHRVVHFQVGKQTWCDPPTADQPPTRPPTHPRWPSAKCS